MILAGLGDVCRELNLKEEGASHFSDKNALSNYFRQALKEVLRSYLVRKKVRLEQIKKYFSEEETEELKELEKLERTDKVSVSDFRTAEKLIRDHLKGLKEKGIREADVINIHFMTRLPVSQIGKIMTGLEKEGVISEDGGEG